MKDFPWITTVYAIFSNVKYYIIVMVVYTYVFYNFLRSIYIKFEPLIHPGINKSILYVGYYACIAAWLTAYTDHTGLLDDDTWQVAYFHRIQASIFTVCCAYIIMSTYYISYAYHD